MIPSAEMLHTMCNTRNCCVYCAGDEVQSSVLWGLRQGLSWRWQVPRFPRTCTLLEDLVITDGYRTGTDGYRRVQEIVACTFLYTMVCYNITINQKLRLFRIVTDCCILSQLIKNYYLSHSKNIWLSPCKYLSGLYSCSDRTLRVVLNTNLIPHVALNLCIAITMANTNKLRSPFQDQFHVWYVVVPTTSKYVWGWTFFSRIKPTLLTNLPYGWP